MSHEGWGPESPSNDATASAARGRASRRMAADHWWLWNRTLRFYGVVLLAGTKLADAVTTAVGLEYVPGIVELNPFADAVFAGSGTVAGLAILGFATIAFTVLVAELLAIEIRRELGMDRLALLAKVAVYGVPSLLFGAVAVNNALLISEQVHGYLSQLLVATTVLA